MNERIRLRLHIEYADGSAEQVDCKVVPDIVSADGNWRPGIVPAEPSPRCPARSDYFLTALNEGGQIGGVHFGDEDDEAFRWHVGPSAVMTEDGYRFHLQPRGVWWSDDADPDACDMSKESSADGTPVFEPPLGLAPCEDARELVEPADLERWNEIVCRLRRPAQP